MLRRRAVEVRGSLARHPGRLPAHSPHALRRCSWPRSRRRSGVSAGHATEQGLALAAARCDLPARRAPLARVRGTFLLHPSGGLVLQAADQQAPPGRRMPRFSPAFCRDILAWPVDGAPWPSGSCFRSEIFDADHVRSAPAIPVDVFSHQSLRMSAVAGLKPGGSMSLPAYGAASRG